MEEAPQWFRWRLAEVIAWCDGRDAAADPENALRSPALAPPHGLQTPTHRREELLMKASSQEWLASLPDPKRATTEVGVRKELDAARIRNARIYAEYQEIVHTLAQERANWLRSEGRYPGAPAADLAGGRLLLMTFDFSFSDGVSGLESEGFFDEADVPPWDTWFACLAEFQDCEERARSILRHFKRPTTTHVDLLSHLVCWVPPELIDLANAGIEVNPVAAVFWAPTDYWAWMRELSPS
jgi:hypothetical protein